MDLAVGKASARHRWSLSRIPELGLVPVFNVAQSRHALRDRRYGRIVTEAARLEAVYGRWWPHCGNLLEVFRDKHFRAFPVDRCELYFQVPTGASKFLTLSYVRSGPQTTLSTFFAATIVLDEIARLKDSNAIVCNVTNVRISDRLMQRWGWEPHCLNWKGRHFIKRLYGKHPKIPSVWRNRLGLGST